MRASIRMVSLATEGAKGALALLLSLRNWLAGALVIALAAGIPAGVFAATLRAEEAGGHIGERATVCGKVASARWADGSKGQPTFLNFGKPYPDQIFTAVIWGRYRAKFGAPEKAYLGKTICVEGRIGQYRGTAQIEVQDPMQISER